MLKLFTLVCAMDHCKGDKMLNANLAEVERVLKICTQVQVQVVAKIILDYKQKYWC